MKHLPSLLVAALFSSLIFTSCKKDYKCDCKISYLGIADTSFSYDITKSKKKDAQSKCDGYKNTWNVLATGSGATVDCSLSKK